MRELRSRPQTNRTPRFADWAMANQTLVAGFGCTALMFANQLHGPKEITKNTGKTIDDFEERIDNAGKRIDNIGKKINNFGERIEAGFSIVKRILG